MLFVYCFWFKKTYWDRSRKEKEKFIVKLEKFWQIFLIFAGINKSGLVFFPIKFFFSRMKQDSFHQKLDTINFFDWMNRSWQILVLKTIFVEKKATEKFNKAKTKKLFNFFFKIQINFFHKKLFTKHLHWQKR